MNCGLFQVRTKSAKEILITRAVEIVNEILKKISDVCGDSIRSIQKTYKERQIKLVPEEPELMEEEELKELKKLVSENDTTMQKLKNEVDIVASYFLILEKYMFNIDNHTYDNFWALKESPQNIKDAVEEANRIITERENKLSEKLDSEKEAFNKKLNQLEKEMEDIKKAKDYKGVSDYFPTIDKFRTTVGECKKEV